MLNQVSWTLFSALLLSGSAGQAQQSACTAAPGASCMQTITVTEAPIGVVNGTNARFRLSRIPSDDTSLKVMLNGQPLNLGTDFRAEVRDLLIVRNPPLKQGDVLQASYNVQIMRRTGTAPERRSDPVPLGTEPIVRQAILDTLRHEPFPSTSTAAAPQSQLSTEPSARDARPAQSRALALLRSRLNTATYGGRQRSVAGAQEGFEGLGDSAPYATYAQILGIPEPDRTGLSSPDPARSAAEPALRSLSMLQRRFEDQEQSQTSQEEPHK